MFEANIEPIEPNQVMRYRLTQNGEPLRYSDCIGLWESDEAFRSFFTHLLATSSFTAFRWETPALTVSNADQPFQFVLLNEPRFSSRKTDRKTYDNYFTLDDKDQGVVSFSSLGGDATLIVPSPRTDISAYGHLAAFVREAPKPQQDALWSVVSRVIRVKMGDRPLWLSTAGGGVAWLHLRLDSRPKYYGYLPFKAT